MKNNEKAGNLRYALGFLLFSIIFIAIGFSICALWNHIGKQSEVSAEHSMNREDITIVIDPGHGGRDGGAVGLSPTYEKDLNLSIALALRDMLSASGINVIMTRTEDVMLFSNSGGTLKNQDLNARLDIAKSAKNVIFVSIHMNSFPIEKYNGLEVYYSENAPESKIIAKKLRDCVISELNTGQNRQIKPAGSNIFLLDSLSCPAILVECGFLSNPEDVARLNDSKYQQKLALVIASSLHKSILEIKETAS